MGRTSRAFGLAGWMLVLLAPVVARAQFPSYRAAAVPTPASGVDATAPTRGMGALNANPLTNPYANPFLNPYAAQAMGPTGITPGQAAMYMIAAQQANGGIGSGRLSGVRPDPAAAAARGQGGLSTTPQGEPRRADSNTPGANAARYFNRGVDTQVGIRRTFNRQNGQFPSSRRGR